MSSSFPVDTAVLLVGLLLAVGVVASGVAARWRIPGLLLFLGLGMIVADDGLAWVRFQDTRLAQNVAVVALLIILFEGGLATPPGAVRRAGLPAGVMATAGVLITFAVVSGAAALVFDVRGTTALLLGAVVASTDAAAVFGALRGEHLPPRVRDLLQLESGANDPIAVLLTIGVVEAWRADPTTWDWVAFGVRQLGGGLAVGILCGLGATWLLQRVRLPNAAAYAVLAGATGAISYGVAAALGASGFLAVYLTGMALSRQPRLVRAIGTFHEGLAATAQAALFLLLGLLVFPSTLFDDIGRALLVAAVLLLVARPLAVAVCLPWFRFRPPELVLAAWAGLRGAVPVVLATIPLTAGYPEGALLFDVVFVTVVISVALQAPAVAPLARRLGLVEAAPVGPLLDVVPVDSMEADAVELTLTAGCEVVGAPLRDMRRLPGRARIAVVVREGQPFVPDGDTVLRAGDSLLVVLPPGSETGPLEGWARGEPPLSSGAG